MLSQALTKGRFRNQDDGGTPAFRPDLGGQLFDIGFGGQPKFDETGWARPGELIQGDHRNPKCLVVQNLAEVVLHQRANESNGSGILEI